MSSKYVAHGSISNSQIAPQRKPDDTYFGELLMKNAKTGENVADNIRYEIFEGTTYRINRFNKQGKKYGYHGQIEFTPESTVAEYPSQIEAIVGRPVDSIQAWKRDDITQGNVKFGEYSMSDNLYYENIDATQDAPATIGGIEVDGVNKLVEVLQPHSDVNRNIYVAHFADGTIMDTDIPVFDDPLLPDPVGYYAEYMSGTRRYFFFSTDPMFAPPAGVHRGVDIMPIIAYQNNEYDEYPHESIFGPEHPLNIEKTKISDALGIDWEAMSRQVFSYIPAHGSAEWNNTYEKKWAGSARLMRKYATSLEYRESIAKEIDLPAYQSDEWNRKYGKSYKGNMRNCRKNPSESQQKFCDKNPTEQAYYDNLKADKEKTQEGSKNITDVYMGLFATAKNLDNQSCVALFYTLAPILPHMQLSPLDMTARSLLNSSGDNASDAPEPQLYAYKSLLQVSSMKIHYQYADWSICRRYGVADPILYPPGLKSPKYKHGDYTVHDVDSLPFDEGDTFHEIDMSYELHSPPTGNPHGGKTMLEIRVQDRNEPITGRPRFLELRLYEPRAKHLVDVMRDGEYGISGSVELSGGLEGYFGTDEDDPYSDCLLWPITFEASREIKLFYRERFVRECAIVYIGAINMQKIKWYQQGWFRIFIIIVTAVITFITGGGYIAVLKYLASVAIMYIIMNVVDSPILKAILQIAAMVIMGYVDTGSFDISAMFLVEAAGIIVQTKIALDMIKLEEEMREFRRMVNSKQKEMEKMEKEVGMDKFNAEWFMYLASLAPVETPEDFYARALDRDLNKIELGNLDAPEALLPAPKGD